MSTDSQDRKSPRLLDHVRELMRIRRYSMIRILRQRPASRANLLVKRVVAAAGRFRLAWLFGRAMKAGIVILIGVAVVLALVLIAREWTRVGPEQTGISVGSAERPPTSMSKPKPQASELPAQEQSAIADVPQERGGETSKEQEQTENVPPHLPPVPAQIFDQLVSSTPSAMPNPVTAMHQRFSEEQPDPSWSPNVEFQLQSYLQNEAARKLFDVVSMECRKTICEIRAVAPSTELTGQSMEALQSRIFGMHEESWWAGYGLTVPAFSVAVAPDGRAVMVAYVGTH